MWTARCSANAVPATAWPGLRPPVVRPVRDDGHRLAGRVRPAQRLDGRVPQVDPGAVGLEQAGRLVDDLLEHLVGLEDGRHARRDLAQRPLRVGAPGDLGPRALELIDEPRVRDRDRGLVGERRQETGVGLAEGVRAVAVDGDRADDHVAVDERRGDDRADADLAHEGVALGRVDEAFVVEVRAGPFDPLGAQRAARDAGVERRARRRSRSDMFEDARMPASRLDQASAIPVVAEQVDHRAGRPEQPDRRVDDRLEDLVLVVRRADAAGDLAQRPLGIGRPGERVARAIELGDEARGPDRDRCLVGDRREQARVGLAPRVGPAARHEQRADRAVLVGQRHGHHRADPRRLDEAVDDGQVPEARIAQVVAGPERAAGDDRLARDALVDRLVRIGRQRLLGLERARRVGAVQQSAGRIDEIDPGAVGIHQPGGLVDAQLERRPAGRSPR